MTMVAVPGSDYRRLTLVIHEAAALLGHPRSAARQYVR